MWEFNGDDGFGHAVMVREHARSAQTRSLPAECERQMEAFEDVFVDGTVIAGGERGFDERDRNPRDSGGTEQVERVGEVTDRQRRLLTKPPLV